MASTRGRQVVVPLTNKSGGSVAAGDVVVIDTGNNDAFTTSTAGAVTGGVGVAQETIANNATGRVLLAGYAALVNVNASVTRGNFGKTHTVVKQATDAGASRVAGTFCQFLTGGTTPDAIVYPADLGGASLTNPMTTAEDIIYGGASGVPTRKAKGAEATFLGVVGGVLAYANPLLPWTVPIDVFPAAVQTTNFDTLTADNGCVGGARKRSTGAQNAVIGWDVVLGAGTWTLHLIHFQDTDRGIYTVAFDGSSVGTIDGYAGSTTRNTRSTITGISVATSKVIRLTLTMATKNASSSSYF